MDKELMKTINFILCQNPKKILFKQKTQEQEGMLKSTGQKGKF